MDPKYRPPKYVPETTPYCNLEERLINCYFRSKKPVKVMFNNPATIAFWKDGTKTVVKCHDGDEYSPIIGLAMCICKKYFGNTGKFNEVFKEFVEGY